MSSGIPCKCRPRDKSNYAVRERNCNHSYFESPRGARHYSDYSLVACKKCGGLWRTKAKYVASLPDET